jgi:hypothetical protein
MRRIYLKESLKSFLEFTALNEEIDIESKDTTPDSGANATQNIEGAVIAGDNISAEIDTILDKLKELEDGIEESMDAIISEVFTEETQLNENAGATLMAMFKSGASLAKLGIMYPKLYKKKKQAELEKTIFDYKFDADKEEKIEAAMAKAKDSLNKQIDKLDDPAAKKKARLTRDTKLEALKKQAGIKLDRVKTDQATKQSRIISDVGDKISKLLGKNKIDSDMISAQWDKTKIGIERDADDEFLKKERKIQDEFIEDPERLKKMEKAAQERVDKEIKEDAEAAKKAEERANEAQAKLDEEIANSSEDEKAALEKIKAYMSGISAFGAATGASAADPENEDLYKEAKTKLSELKKAYADIGDKDYALAFGYKGDSEQSDVASAKNEYSERIKTMEEPFDKIDGKEPTKTKDGKEDPKTKDGKEDPKTDDGKEDPKLDDDTEVDPKELEKANKKIEVADAELAKEAEMQKNDDVYTYKLSGKLSAQMKKAQALKDKAELEGDSEEASAQQSMVNSLRDSLKAQLKKEETAPEESDKEKNKKKLESAKEDFEKKVADKEKEGWKKGKKPDDEHDQINIKEPTGIDDSDGELFYSSDGLAMNKKKEEK